MKRAIFQHMTLYITVAAVFFVSGNIHAQVSGVNSYVFQNFTLSDFGDGVDASKSIVWKPRFSEFVAQVQKEEENQENTQTSNDPDTVVVLGQDPDPERSNIRYMEAKPEGITEVVAGVPQKYVLGVKAQFSQQGYNWIELRPNKMNQEADTQAQPNNTEEGAAPPDINAEATPFRIPFVGKAVDITMWVWGGQYAWWVEVYLRDYLNYQYRFSLGDLLFTGWKQKRTQIPASVVQSRKRLPASQALGFEMIKLWSFPSETTDQFYVYFDLLQHSSIVSTDIFNGKELAEDIW